MNIKLHGRQRRCPHDFEILNLKLLKNVPKQQKLDAYESIFLHKAGYQRIMNDERQKQGNIVSLLYKSLDWRTIKVVIKIKSDVKEKKMRKKENVNTLWIFSILFFTICWTIYWLHLSFFILYILLKLYFLLFSVCSWTVRMVRRCCSPNKRNTCSMSTLLFG
jgi:hypothetical protein